MFKNCTALTSRRIDHHPANCGGAGIRVFPLVFSLAFGIGGPASHAFLFRIFRTKLFFPTTAVVLVFRIFLEGIGRRIVDEGGVVLRVFVFFDNRLKQLDRLLNHAGAYYMHLFEHNHQIERLIQKQILYILRRTRSIDFPNAFARARSSSRTGIRITASEIKIYILDVICPFDGVWFLSFGPEIHAVRKDRGRFAFIGSVAI